MADNGWGEEVVPGIYMIRRGPSASRLRQEEAAQLRPNEAWNLLEQIDAQIARLERSNEEMIQYLADQEASDTPETDGILEQAIVENSRLIEQKKQDQEVIQRTLSVHRVCGNANGLSSSLTGNATHEELEAVD